MASGQRLIVAVDAGGTSTRCVVGSSAGAVLGIGHGGPANHILDGWDTAVESLTHATTEALDAAAVSDAPVDVVVAGSAGVGAHGEGRELIERLLADPFPRAAAVRAVGDMVAAF